MSNLNKEEIKKKAENLAQWLGYNTSSMNLDVINVQEAYCQGYAQALLDIEKDKTLIQPGNE